MTPATRTCVKKDGTEETSAYQRLPVPYFDDKI